MNLPRPDRKRIKLELNNLILNPFTVEYYITPRESAGRFVEKKVAWLVCAYFTIY